jgi:hypothetical protein
MMMRASEPPMKERRLTESATLMFDKATGHSCCWISGVFR